MTVRLIVFLCITVCTSTFSTGAFPALLADLDRVGRLTDRELGALAGIFGFARMLADIPVGLLMGRHIRWALALGPLLLTAGVLCLGAGGPLPLLLLWRAVMGLAHALVMIGALTSILRYHGGRRLGAALNAFEFSAMIGVLGGVMLIGALPASLSWNHALLLASLPQLVGIAVIPLVLSSLPGDAHETPAAVRTEFGTRRPRPLPSGVLLAFAAGGTIAIAYATIEQFLVPLRASRELGLDRAGVARLLMVAQLCDLGALLPVGLLADRFGPVRVLRIVLISLATALVLTGFGGASGMLVGVVFYGLGMAGWMLPLGVLRRETEPADVAWRTALYRVCVDGGMFLGPFASGLLAHRAGLVPAVLVVALLFLAALFVRRR